MSASAILSVLMGGALNGASAIDASGTRPNGLEMPNDGVFAALVDEVATEETLTEIAPVAPVAPVVQAAPQTPLISASAMNSVALSAEVEAANLATIQSSGPEVPFDTVLETGPQTPLEGYTQDVNLDLQPEATSALVVAPATDMASTHDEVAPALLNSDIAQSAPLKDAAATTPPASSQEPSSSRASINPVETLLAKTAAPAAEDMTEPQAEMAAQPNNAAREQAAREAVRAALPEQANLRAHLQANAAAQTASQPLMQAQAHALQSSRRSGDNNGTAQGLEAEPVRTDLAAEIAASAETTQAQPATTPASKPLAAAETAVPVAANLTGDVTIEGQSASSDRAFETVEASQPQAQDSKLSLANIRTTAELAAQFITKMGQRVARFDMVLTPETLGSVDVSMEVGQDGQVQARMVFDTPAAANEMRARAEELRRQLAEAGFNVAENALEFTDRDSQSRGGFHQFFSDDRPGRRAFAGANRLAEAADPISAPVWQSVSLTPRGVDMKV